VNESKELDSTNFILLLRVLHHGSADFSEHVFNIVVGFAQRALSEPLQNQAHRFGSVPRECPSVFANNDGRPRGQQNILQRHLRPAALRAGIGKIGWHTFRHSYSTMLRGAGADIKVQQELLRHSTIQSTLNTYTQAISEQKRAANTTVVGILFNENASPDQPSANGS
jgi:site-specific recombinase XerD